MSPWRKRTVIHVPGKCLQRVQSQRSTQIDIGIKVAAEKNTTLPLKLGTISGQSQFQDLQCKNNAW